MPGTGDKTKPLLALTAIVSPRVQIEGIRLSRSEVRSASALPPGTALRVEYALNGEAKADQDGKRITVCASFTARANIVDGSDSPDPAFHVEAEFLLDYTISSLEGISDEHLQAFGKMNGIYNAWPYWREYVQSMTARMGFPPLALPVLTGEAIQRIYQQQEVATRGEAEGPLEGAAEAAPAAQEGGQGASGEDR